MKYFKPKFGQVDGEPLLTEWEEIHNRFLKGVRQAYRPKKKRGLRKRCKLYSWAD